MCNWRREPRCESWFWHGVYVLNERFYWAFELSLPNPDYFELSQCRGLRDYLWRIFGSNINGICVIIFELSGSFTQVWILRFVFVRGLEFEYGNCDVERCARGYYWSHRCKHQYGFLQTVGGFWISFGGHFEWAWGYLQGVHLMGYV